LICRAQLLGAAPLLECGFEFFCTGAGQLLDQLLHGLRAQHMLQHTPAGQLAMADGGSRVDRLDQGAGHGSVVEVIST
jgi:hypothetical protein